MNCTPTHHDDGRIICSRCKRLFPKHIKTLDVTANCRACIHRGQAVGEVKASCGNCNRVYTAYECDARKRCLPGFKGPWDADHATEAAIYALCQSCPDYSPT